MHICFAAEKTIKDPLAKASQIAEDAARIEALRVQTAAENLANMQTTASNYKQLPYRRKLVFINTSTDKKTKSIRLKPYTKLDFKSKFRKMYSPDHIAADSEGYIKLPNVKEEIEKADLEEARTRCEMHLSVLKLSEKIKERTINIFKSNAAKSNRRDKSI